MAGEVEAKFWLEIPNDRIRKVLSLDSIVTYDIEQIRPKARLLSGAEPEFFDYFDRYFIKRDLSKGFTANDLDSKVRLEQGTIKYGDNALQVSVEGDKDLNEEYQGFIGLLKTFFAGKDKTPDANLPNKYALRIREDRATGKTYLTLKCKHGKADEHTEEYEFLVGSKRDAEEFVKSLGYEFQSDRTKVKKQERYPFQREGIEVHVELNGIEQLGGVRFLEIEAVPLSLDKSPRIDYIYEIARELGIKNPQLNIFEGGNREDRYYARLLKLIAKS